MNDFDPTDPWSDVSPWDVAGQTQTTPTQEPPVTTPPVAANSAPNDFKIGMTLKAASGYDAEWLTPTVYGSDAEDTAKKAKDLLLAMRSNGLIDFVSQAAEYTRGQYKGGSGKPAQPAGTKPSFQNGKVQHNQAPTAPAPVAGDSCPHGRTPRSGTGAKGPWEALFCNERNKSAQCPPLWKQKDGSFA